MTPFELAVHAGEESGIKLELVGGLPVWEAFPSVRHQSESFRIQSSIRPASPFQNPTACTCFHAADIYVKFPDGSLKRPDIAIFCHVPDEQTKAVTMIPEAVVEIISPDYENKDLSVGVPFYLRSGVKDVLVFDPATGQVRHFRPAASEVQYHSPHCLVLACGCEVTV